MSKKYDEKSIESLSPLEFTRLRPGVYCGDTTYSTQLLVEILSNAIDEFNLGHGTTIRVKCDNVNHVYTVEDEGQGFISKIREDGKSILEAAFSVLNTSGKFREDGAYEGTSLGSFGIGSKLTNFLSHYLTVSSSRDCVKETVYFTEGVFNNRKVDVDKENKHGTTVTWQPSEEFFTHQEVDMRALRDLFETITCLCPGLTIILTEIEDKETLIEKEYTFVSENGLNDYVDKKLGSRELLKNRFNIDYVNGKNKMNLVLTYGSSYVSTIVPYVNTGLTETGPHIAAFKTAITREFNKFFKEKKWLKENEDNLSGDDVQEGMYLVFNLTTSGVSYDAQVKSRVVNIDTKDFIQEFCERLQEWLALNEADIKEIATKAIQARKAREAAKKARDAVRGIKTDGKIRAINLPTKLVDAWSKDRTKCELIICEGDSAAGGLIAGRNGETQAVFPIRGKIINCFKATSDKVYANQEINNLVKALGLAIDEKTQKLVYDKKKLRYDKIVMACDAK